MVKGRKNNDCLEDIYTKDEVDDLLEYKAEKSVVTSSINGLMSSEDKTKLDKFQVLSDQVNVWDLDAGIYYLFSGGTINYSDSDSLILSSPITMIVKYASDEWDYTIYAGDKIYKGKTVEASTTIGGVTTYVHTGEINEVKLRVPTKTSELTNDSGFQSATILYNNSTGTTGTVTLSSSAANFSYIEIYYHKGSYQGMTKVNAPNGKGVDLTLSEFISTSLFRIDTKHISISGTSITVSSDGTGYANINSGTTGIGIAKENSIYIHKVVGYK